MEAGAHRLVAVSAFLLTLLAVPVAVGAAQTQPVARTYTLSVDQSTIREPTSDTGAETTVVLTLTADRAVGTNGAGGPITLGGTAKRGTSDDVKDYVQLGDNAISIPAGKTSGSATLRFQTTDDNFWEGSETIIVSAAVGGSQAVPVTITLLDGDEKPTIQLFHTVSGTSIEGSDQHVEIRASIADGHALVEEPIVLTVTPGTPTYNKNFSYDPAGPWKLEIAAVQRTAKQSVTFKNPEDSLPEEGEHVRITGTAVALGEKLAVAQTQFRISDSDRLKVEWEFDGARARNSGRTHQFVVWAKLHDGVIPPEGATLTLTPKSKPGWFSPGSLKFAWDGADIGKTCPKFSDDCRKQLTWSVEAPSIERNENISFTPTVSPSITSITHRFDRQRITLFRSSGAPSVVGDFPRDKQWYPGSGPNTGNNPYRAGFPFQFEVQFDRIVRFGSGATLRVILDSGPVDAGCWFRGDLPNVLHCEFRVRTQDYDLDKKIQVRAGKLDIGSRIYDPDDSDLSWPAPTIPATDKEFTLGSPIYGSGHAFQATATVQEGFREGGGEQILEVLISDVGQRSVTQDVSIPIRVTNGTTTDGDWMTIQEGTVTIPKGKWEGTGQMKIKALLDGLSEGDETLRVGGGSALYPVLTDDLTLLDSPGLILTVSPASAREGSVTQVTFRIELEESATVLGKDLEGIVIVDRGDAIHGTESSGADFVIVYPDPTQPRLTLPANTRYVEETRALHAWTDHKVEGDEVIRFEGLLPFYTIRPAEFTIEDANSTPDVVLAVSPASVTEGGGAQDVSVTATLGAALPDDVVITLDLGGSAWGKVATEHKARDYTPTWSPTSKELRIPANQRASSQAVTLTVTPLDDEIPEGAERITVGGEAIQQDDDETELEVQVAHVAFQDNDARGVVVAPTALTLQAGTSGVYTVRLASEPALGTGEKVRIAPVLPAGALISVSSSQVEFDATDWRTAKDITVTAHPLAEGEEVTIAHAVGGGDYASVTADPVVVTVTEPPELTLALDRTSISENGGVATVTGALDHASSVALSVTVSATAVTPTVSADFALSTNAVLTFAAGSTTSTGTVTITANDNDFYIAPATADDSPAPKEVTISGTVTGHPGIPTPDDLTLEITDDDTMPMFSIADAAADEDENLIFTVTRSGASDNVVSVKWKTTPDASEDAVAASTADYTAVTDLTTLNFAKGDTEKTLTVQITDDDLDEPAEETLVIALSEPSEHTGIADGADEATGTIRDDDDPPSFSIADAAAAEGEGIVFTVTRDGATENVATVKIATDDDDTEDANPAGAGDYTAISTAATLEFAKGVESVTQTIQTTEDHLYEPDETFLAVLSEPALAEDDPGTGAAIEEDGGTATGTITNDDTQPAFSIADASADEGDAITFTVTRSGAEDNVVSVQWNTKADSGDGVNAASTSDYTPTTAATKLDFGEGVTEVTFTVATTEDVMHEDDETFLVELTDPEGGAEIADGGDEATGTIEDDDAEPSGITLTVDPDEVGEEDAATPVTVTAAVNGTTRYEDVTTVTVSVGGGTATSVTDYAAVTSFTITIAAGAASGTGSFTLTPVDDDLHEPDETVDVTGASSDLTITKDTITIGDDDTAPSFKIADASGDEGDGIAFTVTREGAADNVVSVAWATALASGAGAASAADFTAVTATTLTFAKGDTSKTVTVQTTEDVLDEDDETFEVRLSSPAKGTDDPGAAPTISDATAVGTIEDDDAEPSGITLTANPDSVDEDDSPTAVVVTAAVNGATRYAEAKTVTVSVDDASATSPADYAAVSDFTITIAAGAASGTGTFTLTPVNDALDESAETVDVTGSATELTVTKDTITITDDDATPSFKVADASGDEGDGIAFTVTREGAADNVVSVAWATALASGAGAASAADFTAVTATTLSFAKGDTSKTVTVQTTEDVLDEDDETFEVRLSGAAKGADDPGAVPTISDATAVGTIEDNDATPSFKVADASGDEGDGIAFTVTREGAADNVVSVEWATALTSGAGAASAADFTAVTATTLSFAKGDTSKTVTVQTTEDVLDEDDETFEVRLSSAAKGAGDPGTVPTITDPTAVGTIEDDDATPTGITLTANPDSVDEDDSATAVVVTAAVNGATRYVDAKTVTVSVGGGTATSVTDYAAVTSFTITIAAGAANGTGTFTLTPVNDDLDESNETVDVTGVSSDLTITKDAITITDDDATPSFKVADASGDEGDGIAFTVTREGAADNVVSVAWATALASGAGAASAADFTAVTATTLSFAKGDTSKTVTVQTTEDVLDEDDETFEVRLSGAAKGADDPGEAPTITDATAVGTIEDDDATPTGITLTANPDSVGEEDAATAVTVTAAVNGATRYVDAKTVTVSVGGGTATSVTDYAAVTSFTITIAAGAANGTGTFTLTPVNDDLDELDETVDVTGVSSVTVTKDTITIEDNDATPTGITLTANPDSVDEDDSATAVVVTAAVNGTTRYVEAKTVTVSVGGGTATSVTDYGAVTSFTITIAAGAANGTGTFTLTPVNDALDESNETVDVTGVSSDLTITKDAITITDDDAAPSFKIADASGDEGDGIAFTVTREGAADNVVSVAWATALASGAGAASAADFTAVTATTLTFAKGDTSKTVTVQTTEDVLDEDDETFEVRLSSAAKGADDPGAVPTISDATAVGTIEDDDAEPSGITLTANPDSVGEEDAATAVVVTAAVNGSTRYVDAKTVTVSVDDDSATSPADYAAVSDFTITIAAGAANGTGTFTLTPVNDALDESNETVDVTGSSGTITVTKDVITITDDDATPSFKVADASGDEGDGIAFTVTREGAADNVVSVAWATALASGAGAASAADFTAVTATTLSFAASETTKTVTVQTTEDVLAESAETFEVRLSGAAKSVDDPGAAPTISDATAVGTIEDDDAAPSGITLTADPDSVGEADGATRVIVTAAVNGTTRYVDAKTVTVSVGGGTATLVTDYAAVASFTITIAAGAANGTGTFTLTPVNDALDESNETVDVTGTSGELVITGDVITITDDDATPSFKVADATGDEGDGISFTVTREGAADNVVSVAWATALASGAGAASAADFTAVTATTLSFAKGDTSKTVTVQTTEDVLAESAETFEVRLSGAAKGTGDPGEVPTISDATAVGTIEDDDAEPSGITLTANPDSVGEEDSATPVVVTAAVNGSTRYVDAKTVTVSVGGGTAMSVTDYAAVTSFTITIAAGAANGTGTFTLTPVNDDLNESDETVDVTGSATELTVTKDVITITDDDATPSFKVADASGDEGDGIAFTVTREGAADNVVSVAWATALTSGAGAASAADFTAVAATTLSFAKGDTSKTVTVQTTEDVLAESDETFEVRLSSAAKGADDPGGAPTITDATAVGTITDDDLPPSGITLTANPDSVGEEDAATAVVVTAAVNGTTRYVDETTVTVSVGGGTATLVTDYAAVTNFTITIAAGAASGTGTFTLTPVNDDLDESNETVDVTGTSGELVITGDVITITDDDATPSFKVADATGDEGDGISFTVTREGAADNVVSVAWATALASGAGAASAADFTAVTATTLTFAASETTKTVTVQTTEDVLDEDDETFEVRLSSAAKGADDPGTAPTISDPTAVGTIEDDDAAPSGITLTANPDSVGEEDSPTAVVVTAAVNGSTRYAEAKTVTVSVEDASATSPADYAAVSDFAITIAAGAASGTGTFTLTPVNDDLDESNETVDVTGASSVPVTKDTITITDNDDAPTGITLTANPDSVGEADSATAVVVTAAVNGSTRYAEAKTVTVSVEDASATSPADYAAVSDFAITIAAGAANGTGTFTLTPVNDALDESAETVDVTGVSSVTVTKDVITITDDDATPSGITLTANPDSVGEEDSATPVVVTAAVNGSTRYVEAKTVTVSVGGGTAAATDYGAVTSFTITIAAGAGSGTGTFTLTPVNDDLDESNETVDVTGASSVTVTKDVITIEDNDATPTGITLTANPDGVGEADGATPVTVTAAVNGTTRYVDAKTVTVSVGGGTATSVTDYGAVTNFTITIAAGAANGTGTFTLTPVNDALDESNETVDVTGVSSVTVTKDVITITDDDATPSGITLTADPDGVDEDDSATAVVVTAAVNGTTRYVEAKTVTVSVGGGTAMSVTDYGAVTNFTITIAAGAANGTGTFTLTPVNDALDESNETVDVTGVSSVTVTKDTITITDDDATPSFKVADASGDEGDGIAFTVTREGAADNVVSVAWATALTSGAGAASAADFTAVAATTLSFAKGDTSKTVTVQTTEDVLDEDDETFEVRLSSAAKGAGDPGTVPTISDATAVGTIEDDDATPTGITLTANPDGVGEADGATPVTVTAAVNGTTRYVEAKTVTVSVGGGTATSVTDYAAVTSFTITIAAGAGSGTGTFTLTPVNDDLDESNETVDVTGSSGTITVTKDVITITDDDATPTGITLTANPDSVGEEDPATAVVVTAAVNGSTRYVEAKTVTVSVGGGTAAATDYGAVASFTITIAAGAGSGTGTFTLTPVNDALDESNETVDVTGVSSVTVTKDTITIEDNDATPTGITLTANPDSVGEADGATRVTVTAAVNGSTRYVEAKTVTVSVGGGTAAATDYAAVTSFTITIAAGAANGTGTFTLTPVNDALDESNETVDVTGVSSVTVTKDTITITDDDAAPSGITLTADPDAVGEEDGATPVTVTAAVNGSTRYVDATTVTVSVDDDSATSPADYAAVADFTITIAAGAGSGTGTFTLTPVNDALDESAETVDVTGSSGTITVTKDVITITDDDATPTGITLTANPDGVGEADAATAVVVTAAVNGTTRYVDAKTVTVSVGGGTATSVTDYAAVTSFTITIAAGAAKGTGTFTLTPVDDALDESNETVDVTGVSSVPVTKDVITITDDDATPSGITLTANPDSVGEADGATRVIVTAAVNGTTRYVDATTVTVSVEDASATSPADYAAVSDFAITIAAGAVSGTGTFTLTPVNDALDESAETVDVTGSSGTITVTKDVITITDDDATPSFKVADASGDEGDGIAFTVTREGAADNVVSVAWATALASGAGAASAADFTAVTATTLSFAKGDTSKTVTVQTTEDALAEPDETFEVRLSSAAKGTGDPGAVPTISDATAVGTIEDDDATPSGIALRVSPVSILVGEGDGATAVTVTATVNGDTRYEDAKTVTVSVGGGTATATTDYGAVTSFTITIAAGAGSGTGTFTLTPVDDDLDEPNETVEVTGVSSAVAINLDTITIEDNDAAPSFRVADASGAEGAAISFTVTRDGAVDNVVSVAWATALASGAGAASAADFTAVTATTLTFAKGDTSKTVTVQTTQDALAEPDETFEVRLSSAAKGTGDPGTVPTISDATAVGTIEDDDAAPSGITLTANPDSVDEDAGATGVTVTAAVNGSTRYEEAKVVTVSVGGGTATSVTDYGAVTGFAITIAAGAASGTGTFTLTPVDDDLDESDETVDVTGSASGLTVTKDTITIEDGDAAPSGITLTANPDSVDEDAGATGVTVTAAVNGSTRYEEAKVVTVSVGGGTATSVTDYGAVTGFAITIAAGAASGTGTFTLAPVDDDLDEPDETVDVTGSASGLTVTKDTITIEDGDAAPSGITLTANPDSVDEDAGTTAVVVTAAVNGSTRYEEAKVVTVSVGGGTATPVTDYAAVTNFTITIAAGAANGTGTFTLTPVDDDLDESNETVDVTGSASGLTVTKDTITITDDDAAPSGITLTANPDSVDENAGATPVTVTATVDGGTRYPDQTTVTVSVDDDSATSPADYAAVSDFTITIAAGAASGTGTFTLTPVDDDLAESNETVDVTGSSGTITVTKDVITITDEDAAPSGITLTAAPDSVGEEDGATTVTVTATVDGGTRYPDQTTVTVSVDDDSATSPADYAAVSDFTITIAGGAASGTGTFTLTPVDDDLAESDETVEVTGVSGSLVITKDMITIEDEDAAPGGITLTAAPDSVGEEDGATTVTVTAAVDGDTRYPDQTTVTVSVDDDSATSPADYAAVSDFTITIAGGAASGTGTFTLTPVDDDLDESDEIIDITGTSAGLTVTGEEITIEDDDAAPGGAVLSVNPASVQESAGATEVTVTATVSGAARAEATELTISVDPGTAQAEDFVAVESFALTIPAGATEGTATFTLTPVNDLHSDPGETLEISGTTELDGYTVTSAHLTLDNYDPPATDVALTVSPESVAEDAGATAVTVTARFGAGNRNDATALTIDVAGDTATAADFAAVAAFTVTIPAGQREATGTFTLTPVADVEHEGAETIEVSGRTNVPDLTIYPAELTITDDDAAPSGITLTADPDSVAEDAGATTITVTAAVNGSTRFPDARTVTVSVDDDSAATSPADFAAVSDFTITIAAGAASGTGSFTLTPVDDGIADPGETIALTGSAGALTVTPASILLTELTRAALAVDDRTYEFELPEATSGPRSVGDVEEPQDPEPKSHTLIAGDARRFDVGFANGIVFYIGAGEDYETGPRSFDMEVDVQNGPLGRVALAQVRVNVTDVPEPPEPRNDAVTTPEDTPVLIAVLENDSDPDGDELTIVAVSVPGNGTARIVGDRIRYSPDANWYGRDSFTYTVSDPSGLEATALVRVTVTPVNDPPDAEEDRVTTPEDTPVLIAVLENDSDVDGDDLTIVAVSAPENGAARIVGDGIRYSPDENWYGRDSFTYTVSDPDGLEATALVRVTVTPVNDGPEPRDDGVTTPEDTPVLVAVLENDSDIDGDELTIVAVSAPGNGTATIVGDRIRYSPDENWYGRDSFTYTVSDPGGLEATALVRVTVTPVNDPPEAKDDEVETLEDHAVLIAVLDNDSDVDGDALRLVSATAGRHGRTALAGDGLILYSPERDWFGVDRFTYRISDPGGLEDTATVTVTVWPVNDAPYPIGAIPAQHVEEGGGSTEVDLLPWFGDVDDLTLSYEAVSSNVNAVTVTVSGAVLTLIPVVTGEAVITVTATDAGGLSARQRFAVTVGDELIKAVLTDVFAGMGRAHLSSLRSTLGRRLVTGSATNRFNVAGQYLSADRFGQVGLGGLQQTQEMAFGAAGWEANRRSAALGGSLTDPELRPELTGQTGSAGLGSFGSTGEGRWLRSTDLMLSFGGQNDDEDGEARAGRRWTVWGQGDIQSFRGEREPASTYDADLLTAYLGLDLRLGEKWLIGVAGSRSLGNAEWNVGASGGGLETDVTAVHPYLRWGTETTAVWAVGGFGRGGARGERRLTELEDASSLDLALGLVEGRHRLATTRFGLGVDLRAAASRARLATGPGDETLDELAATVQRLRTGVELAMQFTGPWSLQLAPFSAISTLHDAGDGPEGVGLEVAGGLRLNANSLRIEAQGRRLVLHTAEDYREQGFSLNASFGGGLLQPGWSGSIRQRWGASGHGAETLWQDRFSPADQHQQFGSSSDGVDGRLGRGFVVGGSRMLGAFGGYGQMRDSRRVELGLNLGGIGLFGFGPDNPVLVEFAGERYDAAGLAPDYRMRLYGIIRFGSEPRCDGEAESCRAAAMASGWRRGRTELTPGADPANAGEPDPTEPTARRPR